MNQRTCERLQDDRKATTTPYVFVIIRKDSNVNISMPISMLSESTMAQPTPEEKKTSFFVTVSLATKRVA